MSYRNKGAIPVTAYVTREPDLSGNFICDGTADDVEIQAAHDYVFALGGGLLVIERGDYAISATLNFQDHMFIRGAGMDQTRLIGNIDAGSNCVEVNAGEGEQNFGGIEDLTITDTGVGVQDALYVSLVQRFYVERCNIHECGRYGIHYSSVYFGYIYDTRTRGHGTAGVYLTDATSTSIIRTQFYDNGDYNLWVNATMQVRVVECWFENFAVACHHIFTVDCRTPAIVRNNFTTIYDTSHYGINFTGTTSDAVVVGNEFSTGQGTGAFQGGHAVLDASTGKNLYVGNNFYQCGKTDNTVNAIDAYTSPTATVVVGNSFWEIGGDAIRVRTSSVAIGNQILICGGYGIEANSETTILGNHISNAGIDGVISWGAQNPILGNTIRSCTGNGIRAASRSTIIGNVIHDNGGDGIYLNAADECTVVGNNIEGNTGWGILIDNDADGHFVTGNSTFTNTAGCMTIANADCDGNRVKNNHFTEGGFNDSGTGTILDVLIIPFLEPIGAAAWDVTAPGGIDVDVDTEGAFTMGVIPSDCNEVVRIKVWAVALADPGVGNEMEVEFNMDAGQSHEAYNTESITVANHPSNETDPDVNDIISWTFDASDDTDIDDLTAGDCFEVRVMHETAGGPDISTDALFRCVEIHYV